MYYLCTGGVGFVLILCTCVIYAYIAAICAALCPLGVVLNDLNVNEAIPEGPDLSSYSLSEGYCSRWGCKM